jgi:hypothetical protein
VYRALLFLLWSRSESWRSMQIVLYALYVSALGALRFGHFTFRDRNCGIPWTKGWLTPTIGLVTGLRKTYRFRYQSDTVLLFFNVFPFPCLWESQNVVNVRNTSPHRCPDSALDCILFLLIITVIFLSSYRCQNRNPLPLMLPSTICMLNVARRVETRNMNDGGRKPGVPNLS